MAEFELPTGWLAQVTVDCFEQVSTNNSSVKTKDCMATGQFPVIDQGQSFIAGYTDDSSKVVKLDSPIVVFGDHTRVVKWVDFDFVPGADGTKLLKPQNYLYPRFFYHQFKSLDIPDKGYARHFKHLRELQFLVPPLAEQKVIADKLDTLLSQVETTKARLERIPEILKSFRQSVLTAAVTGKLTEEWREKYGIGSAKEVIDTDAKNKLLLLKSVPTLQKKKSSIESGIDSDYMFDLPDSWAFTTWGKVSEWITYGFTKPMPKSDTGIKLLTAKDVQHFEVNVSHAGLTTESAFESLSDKDRPLSGDLLITKDGSIGRAALVRTDEQFCINQSVAVCWLRSTSMNKDYLEYLANSEFTQEFVKDKAQGMAIQHLSIIDFAKCPIPVPPQEEQTEIVRRVEQLFAFADSIEQKANAALARVNNLTQSILAKAFRGELTAEWRAANPDLITGDNSAEALLAKIKAERAKLQKKTKAKA